MATTDEFDNWFTYHPPGPEQVETYRRLRHQARRLAEEFNESVHDCADKTAALRKLREVLMAMNLAVACNSPLADE